MTEADILLCLSYAFLGSRTQGKSHLEEISSCLCHNHPSLLSGFHEVPLTVLSSLATQDLSSFQTPSAWCAVGQLHISPSFFIRQGDLWLTCRFYSAPSVSPLVCFGLSLNFHNIKHSFLVFKKIPRFHDQTCDYETLAIKGFWWDLSKTEVISSEFRDSCELRSFSNPAYFLGLT